MADRLVQVTVEQLYLEQRIMNVFYYRYDFIADPAGDWLENANTQFVDNVWTPCQSIQAEQCVTTSITWKDLTGGVDFFVDSTARPGGISGSPDNALEPSYVSVGFLLRRNSLATRNGYKRFGGLISSNIDGNEFVDYGTSVDDIIAALQYEILGGLTPVLFPVIVKRPLPGAGDPYVYSGVQTVEFRGLGTQNTRKRGRGI